MSAPTAWGSEALFPRASCMRISPALSATSTAIHVVEATDPPLICPRRMSMKEPKREPLSEILREESLVTEEDLRTALRKQQEEGGLLGQKLVRPRRT